MAVFVCLLIISVCLPLASGTCGEKLPAKNGNIYYNRPKAEECSWELPGDKFFNDHTLILKLISIKLKDNKDCLGILHFPGHGGQCNWTPRTCYGYSNNGCEDAINSYEDCNKIYWRCSNKLASDRKITINLNSSEEQSFSLSYTYSSLQEISATTLPAETTHATTMSAISKMQAIATDTTEKEATRLPIIKSHSGKARAATIKGDEKAPTASESQVQENNSPITVIVIPTVVGLLVIILLVVIWMRRRLKKKREPDLPAVHHLPAVQDEEAPAHQHPEDDPYNYAQETPGETSQFADMLYAELATRGNVAQNEPQDDTYDHLSHVRSAEENTAGPSASCDVYAVVNKPKRQ